MKLSALVRTLVYGFAGVGVAAVTLGAMLATPLKAPPPLVSIHDGAAKIDRAGEPPLSHFQARDGTSLAYRLYPAADGAQNRVAILMHGSSGNGHAMAMVGKALAAAGVTAVALDVRGHGDSGERGDIGYVGEVEDDLSDLLDALRRDYPQARFELLGHSLGGGFVTRIAATPLGTRFERIVAVSPFLGPLAPTNRPNEGRGRWAEVDKPRILALVALRHLGVTAGESLPVIHYASFPDAPGAKEHTAVYSFRLLADYGPSYDWPAMRASVAEAAPRFELIAGADDELMDAEAYERELRPLGASVTVLPGVDHIGVLYRPAALAAIVAAVKAAKDS